MIDLTSNTQATKNVKFLNSVSFLSFNCTLKEFKAVNNSISRMKQVMIDKPEDSI